MRHFRLLAPIFHLWPYRHLPRLRGLLKPAAGGLLVDLAGGSGRVSRHLGGVFDRVVVLDLEPAMVRRVPGPLHSVLARAENLPLRDGSADAVIFTDALHHVEDQPQALREARRILKPGGVLVLEEFDVGGLQGRLVAELESFVGMGSTFRSVEGWRYLLEGAGFEQVERHQLSGRDVALRASVRGRGKT